MSKAQGEMNSCLSVVEIDNEAGKASMSEYQRHDEHVLICLAHGSLTMSVDFGDYTARGPAMIMIPARALYRVTNTQEANGMIVRFQNQFFAPGQRVLLHGFLFQSISKRLLVQPINPSHRALITGYLQLLQKELGAEPSQNQTFILQNLMLALLNRVEDLYKFAEAPYIGHKDTFQKFVTLVEHNFSAQQGVGYYCERLGCTQRQLNQILRNLIDQTARDFIIDRVLLEAKRILSFSDLNIKTIAIKLGYDNPFYFSRLFKKRLGLSPEEFRAKHAL